MPTPRFLREDMAPRPTGATSPRPGPTASMDDAAFKKLFSHPRMVTLLIRRHVPEWADRVDYSTLQPLPTELIDEQLRRRYPDMIWRVRTTDGSTDLANEPPGPATGRSGVFRGDHSRADAACAHGSAGTGRGLRRRRLRPVRGLVGEGDVTFEGIFQPTIGGGDDDGHRGDRVPAQPGRDQAAGSCARS